MKPDMTLFGMSGFNIRHERIILIERIVNDCAYAFFHHPSMSTFVDIDCLFLQTRFRVIWMVNGYEFVLRVSAMNKPRAGSFFNMAFQMIYYYHDNIEYNHPMAHETITPCIMVEPIPGTHSDCIQCNHAGIRFKHAI